MKYSPEVLIYLQTIKNFFENNEEVKEYFFTYYSENEFLEKVADISQNNFDKNGEVMLDKTQFESLRMVPEIKIENYVPENDNIFIKIKGYEKICLN